MELVFFGIAIIAYIIAIKLVCREFGEKMWKGSCYQSSIILSLNALWTYWNLKCMHSTLQHPVSTRGGPRLGSGKIPSHLAAYELGENSR